MRSQRMRRRYRRVNGLRLAVAVILCLTSLSCVAMAAARPHLRPDSDRRLIEVTVDSGDTLWALANRYCDRSRDLRATVDEIVRINNLASANLQPGQVLVVPGR